MQIPRKTFILLATVALLAVGVAVSIVLLYPGLPDPETADREGLVRWLVTRDLRLEPMATRHALARRFEEEFCKTSDTKESPDWESLAQCLNRSQRQQFWDNLAVVLEPWFLEKSDRYHELAETQRAPFLDHLIDMLAVLNGINAIQPGNQPGNQPDGGEVGEGGLYALLLGQVQQWKQNVEPRRRKRIDRLLEHMQKRWILRMLGFSTTAH